MNHDPIRYCWECKRPRPRKGFRALSTNGPARFACSDCYDLIKAKRKAVRLGDIPVEKIPF